MTAGRFLPSMPTSQFYFFLSRVTIFLAKSHHLLTFDTDVSPKLTSLNHATKPQCPLKLREL